MATIGMPQVRSGIKEDPLLTLGSDLTAAKELLRRHPQGWNATQALEYLLGGPQLAQAPRESLALATQ